ncbi:MAG: peptidoglycan-binding domain-containing protein [Candidatus Falkowbacteria bacterium]
MLDHLSNNPPQTAADLANENFARREFSINVASVPAATSKVTTATVAAVAPAPATPDPNTELSALKAKLATVEAAEVKRLADAKVEADEKARVATRVKACLAGLKTLGYEDGGVVTIDKIKEFQGKMKLDDDGEVGPATCRAVGLALKAREDCLAKKAAGQSCE